MNVLELKTLFRRRLILRKIREDFNGTVGCQKDITIAVCGYKANKSVRKDLEWLVEHGFLTLERTWNNWSKSYTLTEKAT